MRVNLFLRHWGNKRRGGLRDMLKGGFLVEGAAEGGREAEEVLRVEKGDGRGN